MGSLNYFSYTIYIGSNWYMDTGVRDFKVAFSRQILPDLMRYVSLKDLSNRPIYAVLITYDFST